MNNLTTTDHRLNVLVIGAHPDDCEYLAGGTAIKYLRAGHRVKFVSTTNGDTGHHILSGVELARKRREETERADRLLGLTAFEILDIHNGEIMPTLENRKQVIRLIREWAADIVISHRPNDYHPDHRYTAILVQDAAYQVRIPNVCPDVPALRKPIAFMYLEDTFTLPTPFCPDVIVPIDDVFALKVEALHAMDSQFYEWLPWMNGTLDGVPAKDSERKKWLEAYLRQSCPNNFPKETAARYGCLGDRIRMVEVFQFSEYGDVGRTRFSPADVRRLFPFLPEYDCAPNGTAEAARADQRSIETYATAEFAPTPAVAACGNEVQKRLPDRLCGMSLDELRRDHEDRLFKQYLPFWERGGIDNELGGFLCYLNDDGSVQDDTNFGWFQGRGIWVYSYLFNHLKPDAQFLEIAGKARDFLVRYQHAGEGRYHMMVRRDGSPTGDEPMDVWTSQFAAAGLFEYYRATRNAEDYELGKRSLLASVAMYERPDSDVVTISDMPVRGLRRLGFSFMVVWIVSELLRFHPDRELEGLMDEHLDAIRTKFWNPDYGIPNEYLRHDYSRLPGYEGYMFAGHAVECQWMLLQEALRRNDRSLFDFAQEQTRRLLEMAYDPVFGGFANEDFYVFPVGTHPAGPTLTRKCMWAHTELLIGALIIHERTGAAWAAEWFERIWSYTMRSFANTGTGVWRQAVDRQGHDLERPPSSGIRMGRRKCNFHQPRALMLNLESLERMIRATKRDNV